MFFVHEKNKFFFYNSVKSIKIGKKKSASKGDNVNLNQTQETNEI